MVLPILPVVYDLDDVENDSVQLTKCAFNAIGQFLYHGRIDSASLVERIAKLSMKFDIIVDIEDLSIDRLTQFLDAGAAKVVVPRSQLLDLSNIPPERILVRFSEEQVATASGIEVMANYVSAIIIDLSFPLSIDLDSLKEIVNS